MQSYKHAVCWFRRDIRLTDHAALYHALKNSLSVHCVFVFDPDILGKLSDPQDRRVEFIWHCLNELNQRLLALGSSLQVLYGRPVEVILQFAIEHNIEAVYCNRDYEPEAIRRDEAVAGVLAQSNIALHHYKDQVIFEQSEVCNGSGKPYTVFTPYKKSWLKKLDDFYFQAYPTERYFSSLVQCAALPLPTLESIGFRAGKLNIQSMPIGESGAATLFDDFILRINQYNELRNYPSVKGVSYLSTHLRFGTISIRSLVAQVHKIEGLGAETWLSELVWREFYQMLLYHNPQLANGYTFKPQFNTIPFTNNEAKFASWCEARIGYPLVDAAMCQLNQTGFMHNRLRMVAASFLVKDLQIDWRWGEQYFAEHLLDFDLAANNGGWQWCASTGCDAQPWFRIFNPITQSEKFDPSGKFIRRYIPELANCPDRWLHTPWLMPLVEQQRCGILIGQHYPTPVVDHSLARIKTLALYKACGIRLSFGTEG